MEICNEWVKIPGVVSLKNRYVEQYETLYVLARSILANEFTNLDEKWTLSQTAELAVENSESVSRKA